MKSKSLLPKLKDKLLKYKSPLPEWKYKLLKSKSPLAELNQKTQETNLNVGEPQIKNYKKIMIVRKTTLPSLRKEDWKNVKVEKVNQWLTNTLIGSLTEVKEFMQEWN